MTLFDPATVSNGGTGLALYEGVRLPAPIDAATAAEELDGLDAVSFDRIRVPAGGGLAFTLPEGAQPPALSDIECVLLDHHAVNAYWPDRDTSNTPPACFSMDGRIGVGQRGLPEDDLETQHDCRTCPLNQFGSGRDRTGEPTRGKACKNMHRLYIFRRGQNLPELLTLPPTSRRAFSDFLAKRVVGQGYSYTDVALGIGLETKKSPAGITYSVCKFRLLGVLPPEEAAKAKAQQASVRQINGRAAALAGVAAGAAAAAVPVTGDDYGEDMG